MSYKWEGNLIDFIENKGWIVLNGFAEEDEEGEYTYIGSRGSTVIDYTIVNERVWERGIKFRVKSRRDSDHAPICATLEGKCRGEKKRKSTGEVKERSIITWSEEDINEFKTSTETLVPEEKEEGTVEYRWRMTKEIINQKVKRKTVKNYNWHEKVVE